MTTEFDIHINEAGYITTQGSKVLSLTLLKGLDDLLEIVGGNDELSIQQRRTLKAVIVKAVSDHLFFAQT